MPNVTRRIVGSGTQEHVVVATASSARAADKSGMCSSRWLQPLERPPKFGNLHLRILVLRYPRCLHFLISLIALARCLSRCPFYSFLLAIFHSPSLSRAALLHIDTLLEVVSCVPAYLCIVASLRVHAAPLRAFAALSAPRAVLLQGINWPGSSHKPCETPLGLVLVVVPPCSCDGPNRCLPAITMCFCPQTRLLICQLLPQTLLHQCVSVQLLGHTLRIALGYPSRFLHLLTHLLHLLQFHFFFLHHRHFLVLFCFLRANSHVVACERDSVCFVSCSC